MWLSFLFRPLKRNLYSMLLEVLPIWLLAVQSMVALSSHGDIDGHSRKPFKDGLRMGKKALSGANERLSAFLGRWSIHERHNMDEFMEALGFAGWQRALVSRAGQSYVLEQGKRDDDSETLRIVTQDLRGTSQLELPLSGEGVKSNDGDNGATVERSVEVKEDRSSPAVVMKERLLGEREPYSVCKRTLQPDGRMRIDVTKRTPGGKWAGMCLFARRSR